MTDTGLKLQKAVTYVQKKIPTIPKLAVILGSGLGGFADRLEKTHSISTAEIPFYPQSTVEGHEGCWIYGQVQGKPIISVKGRVHFYEGYSLDEVTFPVRILARLGIRYIIITNAAGSLNPLIRPGDIMLIEDHINLFLTNPLIGCSVKSSSDRFIDMSSPYDPELLESARQTGQDIKIQLKKGILSGSTGPTYETAAEVEMMQKLGGDAGTMSTIPEVIVANQLSLKVLGISCITNMTTALSEKKLDHKEVIDTAARMAENFQNLIEGTIVRILTEGLFNGKNS